MLADPDHEIRHLLTAQGDHAQEHSAVLFVDSAHALAPQLARGPPSVARTIRSSGSRAAVPRRSKRARERRPAAADAARKDHRAASTWAAPRRGVSPIISRTDFLHHFAVIAAFSLENAVNRARLVRSGFTDVLTGWHNRRYLQTRLREELARCHRELTPLTCLMIDVDHFKTHQRSLRTPRGRRSVAATRAMRQTARFAAATSRRATAARSS